MLLKARSVFRSLINEIEHDWIYSYKPKWTCRIFRFLKDVAYYSTKKPYYFLKWYEVLKTEYERGQHGRKIVFISWRLRDPLHINAMVREGVGRIHKPKGRKICPADDEVFRDRNYKKKLWSNKFKYIDTDYECYACLFEPVEKAYATGGEEGGFYFGTGSSWSKRERRNNV